MNLKNIYLVILAGGSGTRLWPLSRQNLPKQFLKIGSSVSLVRETADRLNSLVSLDHLLIVCGESHQSEMKKHFPELGDEQILLEPCARNTAAAIALAAKSLKKKNPEAVMVVLPADHKIKNLNHPFEKLIAEGVEFAEQKKCLMTLGIRPSYPATGYGYILKGERFTHSTSQIFKVDRFQEKPDLKTADFYLKSKNYFWNSGMFIWKVENYLQSYDRFLPKDYEILSQLPDDFVSEKGKEQLRKNYLNLSSISVDYAILEKSNDVYVLEADIDWDDVGSLTSLAKYFPNDSQKNATEGEVVLLDSKENLVLSDQGVVACLGVENLIVIKNKESVLILPKERAEEVKKILEELKREGYERYL